MTPPDTDHGQPVVDVDRSQEVGINESCPIRDSANQCESSSSATLSRIERYRMVK